MKQTIVDKIRKRNEFRKMNLCFLFWKNNMLSKRESLRILFNFIGSRRLWTGFSVLKTRAEELIAVDRKRFSLIPIIIQTRTRIMQQAFRKWNIRAQYAGIEIIKSQQINKSREVIRLRSLCSELDSRQADRIFAQVFKIYLGIHSFKLILIQKLLNLMSICFTNWRDHHSHVKESKSKGLKLEQQRKNEFKRVFLQNLSDYSHRRRMEKLNLKKITQRYQFILKRDALMTMQYIYQRQSRFRTLITSVYRMFLKKAFDNLNFRTFISCSIDLVISSIRHLAY